MNLDTHVYTEQQKVMFSEPSPSVGQKKRHSKYRFIYRCVIRSKTRSCIL